ncbi:MAG: DNA polymerase III subunit [Clostridia bacterium]|nr:DNA polymerase III subunit [Clostridia bacterium]
MFENIIGNDKIKEMLKKTIATKRMSHSYMFIGIDGIGKQLFAKEFAKEILCLDEEKSEQKTYCNKCKSCIEFDTNNNPDYKIIDIEPDEKSIKINQIRDIQVKISEKPIISQSKVYIINNADTMTQEAQNCLLKTLEEPPEYVTIILIGSNENNFLATIKSRCTKIYFDKISTEKIKDYIKEQEQIDLTDDLIELCGGSIKKAIQLKDNKEIYSNINEIVEQLDKTSIIKILDISEVLHKSKDNIYELLDNLNIICLRKAKQNNKFAKCITIIEETKKRLKANCNFDMSIDYMVFNIWREVN